MEAAVNTLGVAADIATLGASRAYTTTALTASKTRLLQVDPSVRLGPTSVKIPKPVAAAKAATSKGPSGAPIGVRMKAATPVKSSTPKAGVKTVKSADGTPSFLKGVDDVPSFLKTPDAPKPTKAKASTKPKATPKPKASAAPKNAAGEPYQRMRDIDFDAKFGTPAEQNAARRAAGADQLADASNKMGPSNVIDLGPQPKSLGDLLSSPKPKAAPKPKAKPKAKASTPKPAAAPKAAKKEINRFADAWDDSPVDMSKVDFKEFAIDSAKPYGTAKRSGKAAPAAKVKTPAPKASTKKTSAKKSAPKVSVPKVSVPKANAKQAFDQAVSKQTSAPRKKLTFSSQSEYNQFLNTGGRERIAGMSEDVRAAFYRVNEQFVKGATKARDAAKASREVSASRSLATKRRYDKARPELKALFNQKLLKRQEQSILAKVTKKKK
jgi:hypothetical protein